VIDLKALTLAVGELEEEKVMTIIDEFIAMKPSEEETQKVITACQDGMTMVGNFFEKGEYFIGDLIFAGEIIAETFDKLKTVIDTENIGNIGVILLGTVQGDLHDIGKNIFKNMAEAVGFKVVDIGVDQPPSAFVDKVKELKPDIVGMSGVLTLALDSMKLTVDAMKEAGLRDSVKVIIGGNPVNMEACEKIGADAFTISAGEGIRITKEWVNAV